MAGNCGTAAHFHDADEYARSTGILLAPSALFKHALQKGDQKGDDVESHAFASGRPPAVVAVVGRSGSGKTTLIERLVPLLVARGLRVATVKQTASFDIDTPDKDSWRHGRAGADAYAVASPSRLAFVESSPAETDLAAIVARFFPDFDLVICEGFRRETATTVEVFRRATGHEGPLCADGESAAIVTDAPVEHGRRFALDDAGGLASFLVERLGLPAPGGGA
jgi:molybdopterin-guanine dinucleotide biosynthesis protein B